MAPFKCPACKTILKNNDSRAITQHNCQCKNKTKSDNILLRLDKNKKQKERSLDKDKEGGESSRQPMDEDVFMLDTDINAPPVPSQIDSLPLDSNEVPSGRPRCTLQIPQCLRDLVPTNADPIQMGQYSQLNLSLRPMCQRTPTPPPAVFPQSPSPPPWQPVTPTMRITEPNVFGIYREYTEWPTYIPKSTYSDNPTAHQCCPAHSVFGPRDPSTSNPWALFSNPTIFRLLKWYYDSEKKSLEDLDRLPDFCVEDCEDFRASTEARHLDKPDAFVSDVWRQDSMQISLPQKDFAWESEADAPVIEVNGVWHCSLTEVLTTAFKDPLASEYHLKSFKEMWWPSEESPAERIYGEAYTSPIYLKMEEKVHKAQAELDAEMASVSDGSAVDAVDPHTPTPALCPSDEGLSSDKMSVDSPMPSSSSSSSLSARSDSSIPDPTQSSKPQGPLENVVVPIMVYSDSTHLTNFGDASLWPGYFFIGLLSKYISAIPDAYAAHHFVYMPELPDIIQDMYRAEFGEPASSTTLTHLKRELMQAVWRLLLDDEVKEAYQHGLVVKCWDESNYYIRVLMACLKTMGTCLCPQCLVQKSEVQQMGTARVDSHSRRWQVEEARKTIFLKGKAINSTHVEAFLKDESLIPTRSTFSEFFQDTDLDFNFYILFVIDLMHKFELNVFKALFIHLIRICYAIGAHVVQILNEWYNFAIVPKFGCYMIRKFTKDVSGLKQMAARDFEDLLQCVLPCFEGLFLMSADNKIVQDLLFILGAWHGLAKLCMHTDTSLKVFGGVTKEAGRLLRHFVNTVCNNFNTEETPTEAAARAKKEGKTPAGRQKKRTKTKKMFNLSTYKLHALGDYPWTIWNFGTTDSYSTQRGEMEHKHVKRLYGRTNKRNFVGQIATHESRQRRLRSIHQCQLLGSKPRQCWEPLPFTDPSKHYHISSSSRSPVDIATFVRDNKNDLAVKDIVPKLKNHILARIGPEDLVRNSESFTTADRQQIIIVGERISDIMMLAPEDEHDDHPYWSGFRAKQLHRVGFLDAEEDDGAFGFIDPKHVLRAVYLLPTFLLGTSDMCLAGASIVRRPDKYDEDYERYYVNLFIFLLFSFVDRDMLMRYVGGAVGHRSTMEATKGLLILAKEAFGVVDDVTVEDHLVWESRGEDSELCEDRSQESLDSEGDDNNEEDEDADEDEEEDEDTEDDGDSDQSKCREPGEDGNDDLPEDPREELGFSMF
ncbi:hypothetical protein EV421DRAFT_1739254 [Armillaria borealis]|uniref:Uncharacterized protein n=1 Tax=Armillaria borealis TaxID=47425 RepID=A0AA39J7F5_9AGAR|nr:hypothetical protein EV421DRAFT_1739254 [Armillaria borealis]